ncbi:MAG: glutathione S-transferase family protein [Rhodoplanes sp.]
MAEYELYCFAQSGNAYRVALMLDLTGADWRPIFVDFFGKGETRTEEYRTKVNEMGEVPVLVHGERKLSQSAVCLTYLAERSGKFQPRGKRRRTRNAALDHLRQPESRRLLGPYRFLKTLAPSPGDPAVLGFLKGRIEVSLAIVDKRLAERPFILGERPTIADLSMCGYMYYPADEFGFDIPAIYRNIGGWLDRIKAVPGWKHPYDLMPGYPLRR